MLTGPPENLCVSPRYKARRSVRSEGADDDSELGATCAFAGDIAGALDGHSQSATHSSVAAAPPACGEARRLSVCLSGVNASISAPGVRLASLWFRSVPLSCVSRKVGKAGVSIR